MIVSTCINFNLMIIYFYIKAKNYHSLKIFSKIIISKLFKHNIKKVKYYPLSKKRTLMSIIKSPHINKSSQEQFEFRYFHRKISVHSYNFLKTLVIFKKYYSSIFSDIKIKLLFSSSKCLYGKQDLKSLDIIGEKILKFE